MQQSELNERKTKILNAIIQNYLETGEPVGSRTISKYTDLNLSSATIRNEMADLEELGYIVQPHTSAGRIPSDKGYRFYVDHLMKEKDKEVKEETAEDQLESMQEMTKSMNYMMPIMSVAIALIDLQLFPLLLLCLYLFPLTFLSSLLCHSFLC